MEPLKVALSYDIAEKRLRMVLKNYRGQVDFIKLQLRELEKMKASGNPPLTVKDILEVNDCDFRKTSPGEGALRHFSAVGALWSACYTPASMNYCEISFLRRCHFVLPG